jgi:hypothetical protein
MVDKDAAHCLRGNTEVETVKLDLESLQSLKLSAEIVKKEEQGKGKPAPRPVTLTCTCSRGHTFRVPL